MDIFSPTIIDNAIITGSNNASLLQVSSPSAASAFFISGSGNVGIGTTTPTVRLHISGTSATNELVHLIGDASQGSAIRFNRGSSYSWRMGVVPNSNFTIEDVSYSTVRFQINNTSGLIGINTTSPNARLHISGANNEALLIVSSSTAPSALFVSGSGNIGIGTATPSVRLHLSQSSGTFQRVDINNANADGVNATTQYYTNTGATPDLFGATSFRLQGGTTDAFKQFQVYIANLTSPRFIINGSGNVGINTTSPTARLHISGANNEALLIASSSTAPSALFVSGSGNVGIGTGTPTRTLYVSSSAWDNTLGAGVVIENSNTVGSGLTLKPSNSVVTNGSNGWAMYAGGPGAAISDGNLGFWAHGTNEARLVIQRAGNVGIGTTSPTARLQVKGSGATSATTALRVENSSAAARLTILDNGTSAFNTSHLYISSSGRVGIGTTTPIAQLHVTNSMLVNGTSDYFGGIDTTIPIQMFAGVANNGIGFRTDNFYLYPYGNNTSLIYGWNGNAAWTLRNLNTSSFQIFNNSPTNAVMWTVSSSGNMGIGTTSPTARLHVSGASNAGLFEIDSPAVNNIIYVSGSGNVGIGTNLPSADLHISGASADNLLRVGSPTQANILFITGSGRVGIGTTTPSALFEVNNKIIAEAGANVGIQTTPTDWIHLSSDPASSKYLRIDAVQNGNPPPDYNPNGGYQVNRLWGSTLDDNALGTPDYWMEIKLNGGIVLIPAYLPA